MDETQAETAWREWFPVDEKSPRPGEREAFLAGLDAANAEREALKQEVADRVGDLVTLQRQLDAALARIAELEADLLDMTKTASEYNDLAHSANADWSKELERATALRAELDNLRASLTKRTHDWLAHCKRLDAEREAITDDLAKAWKELGEIESGASEDE